MHKVNNKAYFDELTFYQRVVFFLERDMGRKMEIGKGNGL